MQVSLLPRVRFLDLVQQRTGEWLGHSPSQVQVLGLGPCDLGQKVDNAEPPCRIGGGAMLGSGCGGQQIPCKPHLKKQAYEPRLTGQDFSPRSDSSRYILGPFPSYQSSIHKTSVLTSLARSDRTLKRFGSFRRVSKPGSWSRLSSPQFTYTREGIHSS
jgi:hypothetical protein